MTNAVELIYQDNQRVRVRLPGAHIYSNEQLQTLIRHAKETMRRRGIDIDFVMVTNVEGRDDAFQMVRDGLSNNFSLKYVTPEKFERIDRRLRKSVST